MNNKDLNAFVWLYETEGSIIDDQKIILIKLREFEKK
jgi:hypothetical protein